MPNILLTGATGFIGSNILAELQSNIYNKIYIIKRFNSKKKINKNKNTKIITYKNYKSLSNKLKLIKADTVIHCATHYRKNHLYEDIEKFISSNILFGNIILENLKNLKTKKFINFSTTWEDSEGIQRYPRNLYAAYKKAFNCITEFYENKFSNISFINIRLVDTFGKNDSRKKLINTLKNNYKKNQTSKIVSKKLYLNLLNVEDVVTAIKIILLNDIKSGKYVLSNPNNLNIFKLIKYINKNNENKIKTKWLSNKVIKNKILTYKKLKNWKPKKSNIDNIKNLILR